MLHVYAIYNKERDKFYIGYTDDLESRVKRHNKILPNKSSSYTFKNSGLWELVYTEEFLTRKDAMKRERELKSAKGRDFIKTLIKNNSI